MVNNSYIEYDENGERPLTPQRREELKNTPFKHCETEEEVIALHFELME